MREPKEHGRQHDCGCAADAPLQKILQPPAKEQLFGNRNKEKREDDGSDRLQRSRPACADMQKPKLQPQRNGHDSVEKKLTQPDSDIAQSQSKVEAHSIQLPYR